MCQKVPKICSKSLIFKKILSVLPTTGDLITYLAFLAEFFQFSNWKLKVSFLSSMIWSYIGIDQSRNKKKKIVALKIASSVGFKFFPIMARLSLQFVQSFQNKPSVSNQFTLFSFKWQFIFFAYHFENILSSSTSAHAIINLA